MRDSDGNSLSMEPFAVFATWNVRFKAIQCCAPHCITEDAQRVVQSCEEGYTGPVCGACDVGYARDAPTQSCDLCNDRPSIFWVLFLMNLEWPPKQPWGPSWGSVP